jgi:replicative DNA helicase
MSKGVQPIANMEAEQSVLGAIMVRPEAMDELSDSLLPDDFYREAHGMIFGAMLYLYEKREPVDLVTVTSLLKERGQLDRVGGVVFLAGLTEQVGFATNAAHYAKIVKDKARLRNFHQLTSKLVGDCHGKMDSIETFLDHAEAQLIGVSEAREMHVKSMAELVPVASDRIEKRYENRGMLTGIPTGFTEIDQLTGGFQSSDLIIIAGRPSMGKTALALNIAENAALLFNAPALVFSMEMSDGQLTDRMIAGNARVDAKLLKSGLLTKDEWARVARAE